MRGALSTADPPAKPTRVAAVTDQPTVGADEAQADQLDVPGNAKKPSKKRLIITAVLGIAVMVGIFTVIFPKLGDYGEAAKQLTDLPLPWVTALIIAGLLNIFAYPFTVLVSVPGLKYWAGFIQRQVGFLISCAIPGGGVFAVGAQYRILAFYKVPPAKSAAAVSADAVWVYLLTLAMPAISVGLLMIEGRSSASYGLIALIGAIIVAVSIIGIVLTLRSEAGARKVGQLAAKVIHPVMAKLKKPEPDVEGALITFRFHAHDLVAQRWKAITVANLIAQLTPFAVLVCALGALGAWPGEITMIEMFAAYSIALLLVSIPISPGGLGTVDLALVALLTAYGVDSSTAVAADVLWRVVWFLPQILTGIGSMIAFFFLQRRAEKREARGEVAPA